MLLCCVVLVRRFDKLSVNGLGALQADALEAP